jgi:hypothetical protein
MATKKKVATKKATKKKRAAPTVGIIYIQPGGTPFPFVVPLDPDGVRFPSKVYWQAIDPNARYRIVLDDAPKPFKDPPDPILTDASGKTPTLRMDKKYAKGSYGYRVDVLGARGKWSPDSGGGIIVDA